MCNTAGGERDGEQNKNPIAIVKLLQLETKSEEQKQTRLRSRK